MSPRAIVTGLEIDFNKHCQIQPGEYVQTDERHDKSMSSRNEQLVQLPFAQPKMHKMDITHESEEWPPIEPQPYDIVAYAR